MIFKIYSLMLSIFIIASYSSISIAGNEKADCPTLFGSLMKSVSEMEEGKRNGTVYAGNIKISNISPKFNSQVGESIESYKPALNEVRKRCLRESIRSQASGYEKLWQLHLEAGSDPNVADETEYIIIAIKDIQQITGSSFVEFDAEYPFIKFILDLECGFKVLVDEEVHLATPRDK